MGTLSVVMAVGLTFTDARARLFNTEQHGLTNTAEKLSMWFWQHRQHMLGEDPTMNAARMHTMRATTATMGQQEAREADQGQEKGKCTTTQAGAAVELARGPGVNRAGPMGDCALWAQKGVQAD